MMKDNYEDSRDALVIEIKKNIKESADTLPSDAKDILNLMTTLINKQEEALNTILNSLEAETISEAKDEIIEMKSVLAGEKEALIRDKFYERVEFVASEIRDIDTERNKLIIWNAQNGDLYMSICPESHKCGISMRFERSGGCSTRNPKLLSSLMDAYDSIAGNFEHN